MINGWNTNLLRQSSTLRQTLDHVRWIAALIVVTSHARGLFFLPRSAIENRDLITEVFYFFSRWGQEAVVLFFVMSGFLIGGKFLSEEGRDPAKFLNYLIDRCTRLGLVTVPAVILSLVLQQFGVLNVPSVDSCGGILAGLGNMVFLQDVLVEPVCNNTPLWSLTNEFWYYLLLPFAIYAVSSNRRVAILSIAALLVVLPVLIWFDEFDDRMVLLYLPAWLVGILIWHSKVPCLPVWLTFSALFLSMCIARAPVLETLFWAKDYLIGLSAMFFFRSVAQHDSVSVLTRLEKLGSLMAGFSFSLYLIHYPILILIYQLITKMTGSEPAFHPHEWSSYLIYVGLIVVCLVAAYVLALATEFHTYAVKSFLKRRLLRQA